MIRRFLVVLAVLASAFLIAPAAPALADEGCGFSGGCTPNYPPDPGCTWVWNGTTYVQDCGEVTEDPAPVDSCQTVLDEQKNYYLAVIDNYKDAVASALQERDYWHAAMDKVAENAVQRNIEYAAVVSQRDALRFKNASLRQKIRDLREQLRNN